jgi:hypothetical protein
MRVLDITSAFSSSCGGIKRYYQEKARALPRLGVECHFVVPGAVRSTVPFGGGTMHRLPGPTMPGNPAYRLFGVRSGAAGRARLRERYTWDAVARRIHGVYRDLLTLPAGLRA